MAAEGEQMTVPAPIAPPSKAQEPPADGITFADGEVPSGSAVAGGLAAAGEATQGENPQGSSPSPLVPRLEDGGTTAEEKAAEVEELEEEAVEAGEAGDAGRGDSGGGGGKRKGALFLPDAKRRKACTIALERPPAAEESATAGGGGWPGGGKGRGVVSGCGASSPAPFSFSFDTRCFGAPAIETTPKFGSFNFAPLPSDGGDAEPPGTAAGGGAGDVSAEEASGGEQ